MATYTVSRKTWLRGIGSDDSYLLTPDGMRCCLGFVGSQCGIKDIDLLQEQAPKQVPSLKWPAWLMNNGDHTVDCWNAISANDDETITGSERESRLRAIFAAHGDEIIFTD